MTITLLIFGHSHVWSVRRALAEGFADPRVDAQVRLCGTSAISGTPMVTYANGKSAMNPAINAALYHSPSPARSTWLVSMLQGNFYNQLGMVWKHRPFDFVLPEAPDLPMQPRAAVLPLRVVEELLLAQMPDTPAYIEALGRLDYLGKSLIGPPPPPRGTDEILALLREKLPDSDGREISAPHVRLKLWRLQNRLVGALCAAAGVHYQPGDLEGTVDEDGFLLAEFVKDAVHANAAYSARLLSRLADVASASKE